MLIRDAMFAEQENQGFDNVYVMMAVGTIAMVFGFCAVCLYVVCCRKANTNREARPRQTMADHQSDLVVHLTSK